MEYTSRELEDMLMVLLGMDISCAAVPRLKRNQNKFLIDFIAKRQLPAHPLNELEIVSLLHSIALIDSNNDNDTAGVGEREGRVYSRTVASRNYGFAHGIGRSGDLLEAQPKALGSAILQQLTHRLVKQALRVCGLHETVFSDVIVLPCATGMAIMLTLRALHNKFGDKERRKVIWPRIDQKSAIKAVQLAGLELVVVPNRLEGDEIRTDLEKLEEIINEEGADSILCVLSTTSCFAPRIPDRIVEIGEICNKHGIGHIVNNAYGLQSNKAIHLINETVRTGGRLDAIVQSTDKNFMVPVGGSIVTGPDRKFISEVGKVYPGRASISPLIDLCCTLLEMGRTGLDALLKERIASFQNFREKLRNLPPSAGRLLETPHNDVSMALADLDHSRSHLGSMLFCRNVSGARMVGRSGRQQPSPDGLKFALFGAHYDGYPCEYLTVASAIGQKDKEIDEFIGALLKCSKQNRHFI